MSAPVSLPADARAYLDDFQRRIEAVETPGNGRFIRCTKANLPSAADRRFWNAIFIISDGISNRGPVFSDTSVWRYFDGTAA